MDSSPQILPGGKEVLFVDFHTPDANTASIEVSIFSPLSGSCHIWTPLPSYIDLLGLYSSHGSPFGSFTQAHWMLTSNSTDPGRQLCAKAPAASRPKGMLKETRLRKSMSCGAPMVVIGNPRTRRDRQNTL